MQQVFAYQMQQAVTMYKKGSLTDAHQLLILLVKQFPGQSACWHLLALVLRKMQRFVESGEAFACALKLEPDNAEILTNFATLLKNCHKKAEARQVLLRALSLAPAYFDALYNLGGLEYEQRNYNIAQKWLSQAVLLKPAHVGARHTLAQCHARQGKIEEAVKVLDGSSTHEHIDVQLLKIKLLRETGQYDRALTAVEHVISRDGLNTAILIEKALLLYLAGDADAGIALLQQQISTPSRQISLYDTLADLLWLSGSASWYQHYEQAISLGHPEFYLSFCTKLIKAGEQAKALALVDQWRLLDDCISGRILHGYLLRETGQIEQSLQLLKETFREAELLPELYNELALTALAAKDYALALDLFTVLVQRFPENQSWFAQYAGALKVSGDFVRYRQLYPFEQVVKAYMIEPPVGYRDIVQFNQNLLDVLLPLHQAHQHPLAQSLRTGTQTEQQLFMLDIPVVRQLKQLISEKILQYIQGMPDSSEHPFFGRKSRQFMYTGSWSVKLYPGGFHRDHYHGEGWISGCYYVDLPLALAKQGQGWIKFGQAELSNRLVMDADYYVRPQAGLVVLFPSMMWHGTVPFIDEYCRITVAFDLIPQPDHQGV